MANKVLLKKSSVAAKVPLTTDLEYGELALNYADGKLYFKNASNAIKSFTIDDSVVTLTGTQTLTNKTLTSPSLNTATANNLILTGSLTAGGSAGSSGQVLQSTGTGVQWATPAGGGGFSDYVSFTSTGITSLTSVYSVSATTYRAAKYTIQVTNGSNYGIYEFLLAHDGTSLYFPYNASSYVGDSSGNNSSYFSGDYLDSLAMSKIQIGATHHAFGWAISSGNLVFSASSSSGAIDVKGAVLLIRA
jgi:hypothetical protein